MGILFFLPSKISTEMDWINSLGDEVSSLKHPFPNLFLSSPSSGIFLLYLWDSNNFPSSFQVVIIQLVSRCFALGWNHNIEFFMVRQTLLSSHKSKGILICLISLIPYYYSTLKQIMMLRDRGELNGKKAKIMSTTAVSPWFCLK